MIDITFNNNSVIQYIITVRFIGEENRKKRWKLLYFVVPCINTLVGVRLNSMKTFY